LFALVGLDPSAIDRFPHEFSGGQRERIGLARKRPITPIRRRTSADFPRVAPSIDHQHQRREPA
jgi:peptide/nickel transport system ATP-binding protein